MTVRSPSLSAKATEDLFRWAITYFEDRVREYLRALNQDGYLPLSLPPANELQEMDMLQKKLPQIEQVLAQPPSPDIEALRQQAQQDMQRLLLLRLKYHGGQNG